MGEGEKKQNDSDLVEQVVVPEVVRMGFLDMQVCVPKDWTDEQARKFAEKENSCGTTGGWHICEQGHELLGGDDARVQCAEHATKCHIKMVA